MTVNKVTQTPSDEDSVYSTQHCTLWHLRQHVLAHGEWKQFSDKECFSDKATIRITRQADKHICILGSHNPSLGGTSMAVRRKYILYNKPNENLFRQFFFYEKPITRISYLGHNVAVPCALATGHIIQQDGMPPNFHSYARAFFNSNFPEH